MPLPLVPFEEYLLADDRSNCPMSFFYRLKFLGKIEREVFQAALAVALGRHPLLQAVLRRPARGGFRWESAEGLAPRVSWHLGGGSIDSAAFSPIDLSQEVGLRLWVREAEDRAEALFQFHHVCCDGLGAMRFLEDVLASYHALATGIDPAEILRPLDPGSLLGRGKFGRNGSQGRFRPPRELLGLLGHGLLGTYEYFAHRVLELPPRQLAAGGDGGSRNGASDLPPATCEHSLTREQTAAWRKLAKKAGCTANDLLLRDLYVALGNWAKEHGAANNGERLRIMIPVSLRRANDHLLPAANRVSMIFLDRSLAQAAAPAELLDGLRRDMKAVKEFDLGMPLLFGIRVSRRLPGGLKAMLPEDRCLATALFTNVLDPTVRVPLPRQDGRIVAGNLLLEKIEGFPPRRPKTYASFAALLYADRLSLSLSYDPQHLVGDSGRQLLDSYVAQILASLGIPAADRRRRDGGGAEEATPPFAVRRTADTASDRFTVSETPAG